MSLSITEFSQNWCVKSENYVFFSKCIFNLSKQGQILTQDHKFYVHSQDLVKSNSLVVIARRYDNKFESYGWIDDKKP